MEFSDWHRQQAAAIAAAHPLDCRPALARGNHLAAQNDEPEPALFTDAELAQADLQSLNKTARFHQQNDRAARDLDRAAGDRGALL